MSRNEEENFSYIGGLADQIVEELDRAIGEVTHLLSLECVGRAPNLQHQLFEIGKYLCQERARLGGEPDSGIRFGKLKV